MSPKPAPRRQPRNAPRYWVRMWIGWLMVPATVWVVVWAGVGFLSSDYFRLQEVVIRGADRTLFDEVAGNLTIPPDTNTIFFRIEKLASQARTCPRVLDARVDRAGPNRICLTLAERQPVFAMASENGFVLVDREGILLLHTSRPGDDLPTVFGAVQTNRTIGGRLDQDSLAIILACIEGAQQGNMPPRFELHLDTRYDYKLRSPAGTLVKLGGPDNLTRKVIVAASIERHLLERDKTPEYIDVRLAGRKPSYKLRHGSA